MIQEKQGKILYYYSLLGKKSDKSQKMTELTNFKENSTRYVDIFNSTNVLYEELRQSCI